MCACECRDYETLWNAEHAAKDLKRYRAKGPDKTTRLLVEALEALGVTGASILDIGAGIGVVHHELLSAGARSACAKSILPLASIIAWNFGSLDADASFGTASRRICSSGKTAV